MKSDIEIAKSAKLDDIYCIAKKTGINEDEIIPWGAFKAKISLDIIKRIKKDEYWVAGTGVVITISKKENSNSQVGLLSVDQCKKKNGEWSFRRLNGDQTHQGRHIRIPVGAWDIQKIRLYDY